MMKKHKFTSRPIIFAISIIVILGIALYWFFLGDYFAYKKVVKNKTIAQCEYYAMEYTKGYYLEEVRDIETALIQKVDNIINCEDYLYNYPDGYFVDDIETIASDLLQDISTPEQCLLYLEKYPQGKYAEDIRNIELDLSPNIELIKKFIEDYPNSRYSNEVNSLKNNLWDKEIARYLQISKQKSRDPDAVRFFNSLLNYMKENNLYDIKLKVIPKIKLKDYSDYSELEKLYLDAIYTDPPIRGNIIALKSNFSQGRIETLRNILKDGISSSFNKLFTPGFINISDNNNNGSNLAIEISYEIQNEMYDYNDTISFPNIWTYTEDDRFSSYLLGISVDFDFNFVIPNTELSYRFVEHAEPSDNISNIDNIRDGYTKMTKQTFEQYVDKISNTFRLEAPNYGDFETVMKRFQEIIISKDIEKLQQFINPETGLLSMYSPGLMYRVYHHDSIDPFLQNHLFEKGYSRDPQEGWNCNLQKGSMPTLKVDFRTETAKWRKTGCYWDNWDNTKPSFYSREALADPNDEGEDNADLETIQSIENKISREVSSTGADVLLLFGTDGSFWYLYGIDLTFGHGGL